MRDRETVLLLTAWHLPHWRSMPLLLLGLRRLERGPCRVAPGRVRSHRWMSRRSLLLTSWWESQEAAERWLATEEAVAFDRRARAAGARAVVDLRSAGATPPVRAR